ncbi:MAG TPA: hypothetical protein VK395_30325 [Gemmataceae bacterium]|nr:hypothetical protein [Gemmataceae bacterium]
MKTISLGMVAFLLPAALWAGGAVPGTEKAEGCAGSARKTVPSVVAATLQAQGPAQSPGPLPPPAITLHERRGQAIPQRTGFQHTAGGNIDVAQPTPDVVVVTMTGVAVAGAHPCKDSMTALDFDLTQCIEIGPAKPEARKLNLTLEARVIGLLRSHHKSGVAEESGACAAVACGSAELVTVCSPPHAVGGGDNLSINDHNGPVTVVVVPGNYTLHQGFHVGVSHAKNLLPCKAASAEFAPDPALDPLWISYLEPFHGAVKKEFGFQVILKVAN